ncbi:hypothetical protein DERF_007541 [Dermatophagoides farinae]|uniref:Uncharacterized protein n=2 Tax=Dermatophagoides farinae TaxID=6954 RepID=A0A922L394_DERFA|nr:hypothetical protein DERF_007541 [Dermatophagoides farinae]
MNNNRNNKIVGQMIKSIIGKINQQTADFITLVHCVEAMTKLRDISLAEKWLNFTVCEDNWRLLLGHMESQLPNAGELSARLAESLEFAKAIESRISLIKKNRPFLKTHSLVLSMNRLKSKASNLEECLVHRKKFKSFHTMVEHIRAFHPEAYEGSLDENMPGPSRMEEVPIVVVADDDDVIAVPPTVVDWPSAIDDNESRGQSNDQEDDDERDDDDRSVILIVVDEDDDDDDVGVHGNDDDDDENQCCSSESSLFFDSVEKLRIININHYDRFQTFARKIVERRVKGTKIDDLYEITMASADNPDEEDFNKLRIQFAKSMYLQRKFIRMGHGYIPPRELTAECFEDKSLHKFYYSPIEELIKTHLLSEEILSNILNERPEDASPYILDCNMLNTLRLVLYGDDFGFTGPLGTGRNTQKIFSLYLDTDNSTKYRSKSEDFPAVLLANRKTIKATSIQQILSPLVSDLKRLEDRGLFVLERGITIKVRLAYVIGDNLGVSELLGFKQNFSTHFVCRFCGATYQENQDLPVISRPLNINTIEYSEARLSPGRYGIMRSSEFFKLNCNLFKLAPPDLFHDIQEGILTDVTQSILIGMKKFEFFCRLVELFPALMNDQDEASRAYRNFRYMIFSMYSASKMEDPERVRTTIFEVQHFCWNKKIRTAKSHFISHYLDLWLYYGQLFKYSTARFERQHASLKQHYKQSKNFRNVAKALAQLHQESLFIKKFWTSVQELPFESPNLAKTLHPFSLGHNIVRAVMGDGRSFIKATSFYTQQGAIFVSGQIYEVESQTDEFIFSKAVCKGPMSIPVNELSHNNGFLFEHDGDFFINYIIKK